MDNAGYIFAAFSIVWAALFAYVLVIIIREGKLRREIEALKEELHDKER